MTLKRKRKPKIDLCCDVTILVHKLYGFQGLIGYSPKKQERYRIKRLMHLPYSDVLNMKNKLKKKVGEYV